MLMKHKPTGTEDEIQLFPTESLPQAWLRNRDPLTYKVPLIRPGWRDFD